MASQGASHAQPGSPTRPSASPISPTSSRIPLPALKASIQAVINTRERGYAKTTAVVAYWKRDNTGAKEDANSLEKTLQDCLGIRTTKVEIDEASPAPRRQVTNAIAATLQTDHAPVSPASTLLIFTYIGHGAVYYHNRHSELWFESQKRSIRWEEIRDEVLEESVDLFAILDCCSGGLVSFRATIPRTIKVLTACGPNQTARTRDSPVTFTQRVCAELKRCQEFDEGSISVDCLHERLQQATSSSAKPRIFSLGGVKPIILRIPRPSSPSRIPRPSPPSSEQQHVVVKLVLSGPEAENVKEFQKLLAHLPKPFKVHVIDAYKTTKSALVLLRMTGQTWSRLDTVVELPIIGVAIGESLVQDPQPAVPQTGENLPLRQRQK